MKIYAQNGIWRDNIEIFMATKADHGDGICIAQPIQFKCDSSETRAEMQPVATLILKRDDAQKLMDELWNVGLRPTEGSGSAGMMAATQDHLQDMRRLVFSRAELQTVPPKGQA